MKRAAALLWLLILAACGGAPAPVQNNTAVPPDDIIAPDMRQPTQGQAPAPTPSRTPMQSGTPPERFIVCPGNPRCPPAGSRPRER